MPSASQEPPKGSRPVLPWVVAAGAIIPALIGLLTFLGLGRSGPASSQTVPPAPPTLPTASSIPSPTSSQTLGPGDIAVAIGAWTVGHPSPEVERYEVEGTFSGELGPLSDIVVGARLADDARWVLSDPATTSGHAWEARIDVSNPTKADVRLQALVISPSLTATLCPTPSQPGGPDPDPLCSWRIWSESKVVVIRR